MKYGQLILLFLLIYFSNATLHAQNEPRLLEFRNLKCGYFQGIDSVPLHAVPNLNNRISGINTEGDTTQLRLFVKANCGMESMTRIKFEIRDSIVHLEWNFDPEITFAGIEHGDSIFLYEPWEYSSMDCECYFCFEFDFINLPGKPIQVYAFGKELELDTMHFDVPEKRWELFMGDTINYYDRYGRKQGRFIDFDEAGRIKSLRVFADDTLQSGFYGQTYFPDGRVKSHYEIVYTKYGYRDYTDVRVECVLFDERGCVKKRFLCPEHQ